MVGSNSSRFMNVKITKVCTLHNSTVLFIKMIRSFLCDNCVI